MGVPKQSSCSATCGSGAVSGYEIWETGVSDEGGEEVGDCSEHSNEVFVASADRVEPLTHATTPPTSRHHDDVNLYVKLFATGHRNILNQGRRY